MDNNNKFSEINQIVALILALISIFLFSITKDMLYGFLIITFMLSWKYTMFVRWIKTAYFFYQYEVKRKTPEHNNWDDYISVDMRWFSYFAVIVLGLCYVYFHDWYLLGMLLLPLLIIIVNCVRKLLT